MIKTSKRMLKDKSKPILNKFKTILIGDPYCGKSSYIKLLAKQEKESGAPILMSDDQNEFEFSVGNKSNRAIFIVRDTANQERYRSLTQNYYRKVHCVLLIFNKYNEESFYNLNKWHSDIVNYSNNQDNNLAIVLVCMITKPAKNTNSNRAKVSDLKNSVSLDIIEKFQKEKKFIVGYCEIDLTEATNLKEPFEILFEHLRNLKYVLNESQFYLNQDIYNKIDLELNQKTQTDDDDDENKCCNII